MIVDYSFIRLFKNNFELAKKVDDPLVATIVYNGFIVQQPNETFVQRTNTEVAFAGGITVDLINECGAIVQNINDKFYYNAFVDDKGIEQIEFEFGMIGLNYYSKVLYLKITDNINGNIFYSNGFLVTNNELSTRFDYKNANEKLLKSVRLSNCYIDTQTNKLDFKSYTNTKGTQTSYRQVPTYLQKYKIDSIDFFNDNRLTDLFTHSVIYVNGMRSSVSDYKVDERKGKSNLMSAEFTVNPLNEIYNWSYQIFESLEVISFSPVKDGFYTLSNFNAIASKFLQFNKTITLVSGTYKLYKEGIFVYEFNLSFLADKVIIDLSGYTFVNGSYSIVIANNQIFSNAETFVGLTNWNFTIASGEFLNTDFSNEFLIN